MCTENEINSFIDGMLEKVSDDYKMQLDVMSPKELQFNHDCLCKEMKKEGLLDDQLFYFGKMIDYIDELMRKKTTTMGEK